MVGDHVPETLEEKITRIRAALEAAWSELGELPGHPDVKTGQHGESVAWSRTAATALRGVLGVKADLSPQ